MRTRDAGLPSLAWGVLLVLAAAALPLVAPAYYLQLAAKALLVGLAAMALNLVVGFGGLVSLCHAAFYGLAGYVLALAPIGGGAPSLWLTLPAAVGVAAAAAALIGALSLRTRGIYFIMVTLAFGEMIFYFFHDTPFAGGSDGIFVHLRPEAHAFGRVILDLDRPETFYWTALSLTAAGALALMALVRAPFGRALEAARANERRARALGFPVFRLHLIAFTVSGALAGVAGYFATAQFGFVAPQMLGWHLSALLLVMVVLGGMRGVTGPLAGAALLIGLEEALQPLTPHWKLALGGIVILLVLAFPQGMRQLVARVLPLRKTATPEAVHEHSAGRP